MEKLIELLNEYVKEQGWLGVWSLEELNDKINQIYICSKYYEFIKWLVDNDKIKLEELKWHYMDLWELVRNTEFIIMLLSIQDNPIEFLVSILK